MLAPLAVALLSGLKPPALLHQRDAPTPGLLGRFAFCLSARLAATNASPSSRTQGGPASTGRGLAHGWPGSCPHLDQIGYDTALECGWPIAAGTVEGACRYLIADRFDVTGSRWGPSRCGAVLRLRTVTVGGDLDTYWRYHSAREHQRLYPTPDQQEYRLSA
ncbi:hypothetical protein ACFW4X_13865 [Streptomyces smyrnaeus]|uniref:hypothetical protein n=1 Tax=Streptomyces smyrnaeus TaxID=1387713 RepID=UPI003685958C